MKNEDIRLVISDLDGTLLDEEKKVSIDNIKAIENLRNKGIKFGIATGRNYEVINKLLPMLGIEQLVDVKVCLNGNVVEINGEKKSFYNLTNEELLYAYNASKQFKELSFVVGDGQNEAFHCSKINKQVEELSKYNYWKIIVEDMDTWLKNKICLECMYVANDNYLKSIYDDVKRLEKGNLRFLKTGIRTFEIFNINVSKANGLKAICEKLNISLDNVLSIGDSENDLDMIVNCGVGVAMNNAMDDIKKSADYITEYDNNHSGVAEFLNRYFSL